MTTVVLQRGHGGRRTGAVGAPGEQAYAAGVATRAVPLLGQLGATVRVIDADVPASRYAGDLFIAIHYDGGPPGARGPSVGFQTPQGARLASLWKDAYRRRAQGNVGPWRRDNYTTALSRYYGVRIAVQQGNRAAIITEGGFGSHPTEGRWLRSEPGMQAGALSIRDAVATYAGRMVYLPPAAAAPDQEYDEMKRGDTGGDVRKMQERLQALGHYDGALDGVFGPATEQAVRAFQQRRGLTVSGRVSLWTAVDLQGFAHAVGSHR